MKVAVLHAYSRENAGDGVLVWEALNLVRDALGPNTEVTLFAQYPQSFDGFPGPVMGTLPTSLFNVHRVAGPGVRYLDSFDLVLGVGGGYLRSGRLFEAAKCAVIHLPQIFATAKSRVPTVYLPQSVGPFRFGTRSIYRSLLRQQSLVLLRDDRSVEELALPNVRRVPDLAVLAITDRPRDPALQIEDIPVLSVRSVQGKVSPGVRALAERLAPFVGMVQSTVGHNDDCAAMEMLKPTWMIPRDDFHDPSGPRRVAVVVRLHAALMALKAGHYVIHLAYERKGFGAYSDLGLEDYVHPIGRFDPDSVAAQAQALREDEVLRRAFDEAISSRCSDFRSIRSGLVHTIRGLAPHVMTGA